jgi:hypothetical protein
MQRFLQTFSAAHKAPFEPVCKRGGGNLAVQTLANHPAPLPETIKPMRPEMLSF